jgi:hypothetical protein
MELASATASSTSGRTPSQPGTPYAGTESGELKARVPNLDASPLVLPESETAAKNADMPDLDLDKTA